MHLHMVKQDKSKSHLLKSALILFILVVVVIVVKDDKNPVGLRLFEVADSFTNRPGTLNGFFASVVNPELCMRLTQTGRTFQSTAVSSLMIILSINGTFNDTMSSFGAAQVENSIGDPARGVFEFSNVDGKDTLRFWKPGQTTQGVYVRTTRSKCPINNRPKSCIGRVGVEKHGTLSPTQMDAILGSWSSRHGDFSVAKLAGGQPNQYKLSVRNDLRYLMKNGLLAVTQTLGNGEVRGIISMTLYGGMTRDVRFVMKRGKVMLFNCDRTPTKWVLSRAPAEQDL